MNRPLATIGLVATLALSAVASAGEDPLSRSVLEEPARVIVDIYRRHHDWKTDEGVALATKALADLEPLLKTNPEGEIADARLKTRKVKQIASTLHTLLGMLGQRQALKLRQDDSRRREKQLAAYDKGRGRIDSVDIEQRIAVEQASANLRANAVRELRRAIEIDPGNPSPHYELAKIYAEALPGATQAAEEEYYRAALCARDEGDAEAAQSTLSALAALNPRSRYLAQFRDQPRAGAAAK